MKKIIDQETQRLARTYFRDKIKADAISSFKDEEEGYIYKAVTTNYIGPMANNLQNHLDVGFEFVISKEPLEDDRAFAPSHGKEGSLKPNFVTRTTTDGYEQVYMRIKKEVFDAHKNKQGQEEIKRYLKAVGSKAKTMNEQGNNLLTFDVNGGESTIDGKISGDE